MEGDAAAPPTLGILLLRGSNVNRMSPFLASAAWNFPFPSPKNSTSPPTARPDFAGRMSLAPRTSWKLLSTRGNVHAIFPVRVSRAPKRPKGCEPGTLLVNLEPRWRSPVAVWIRSLLPDFVLNVVG